jgi:hypothetical protein
MLRQKPGVSSCFGIFEGSKEVVNTYIPSLSMPNVRFKSPACGYMRVR